MSDHVVTHATFTLQRTFAASPPEVFAAWADPATKARWFATNGARHELDFRVGGTEAVQAEVGGARMAYEAHYRDIVDGERIVSTGTLFTDGRPATVSVSTIEFEASEGGGTRLTVTEQGAHLDGLELPEWREQGVGSQLDALAAELERQAA